VTLTGDLSARDLFIDSLTEEDIEQAKESVRETEPTLMGGALRNAAVAQLWQDADHDHWDQKKVDFLSDTYGYVLLSHACMLRPFSLDIETKQNSPY